MTILTLLKAGQITHLIQLCNDGLHNVLHLLLLCLQVLRLCVLRKQLNEQLQEEVFVIATLLHVKLSFKLHKTPKVINRIKKNFTRTKKF